MSRIEHRDMGPDERAQVEHAAWAGLDRGWSSKVVAAAMLLGGSFVAGVVLFGLPATALLRPEAGSREGHLTLLGPAVATMLFAGTWSVSYYLRGVWRAQPQILEDLDYGRVEVLHGTVRDAWVVDDEEGTTWLLDLGDEVLVLAPGVAAGATSRTFPGRGLELARCKHSGLVVGFSASGPALAPTRRLRGSEVALALGAESVRLDGALEEVCGTTLRLAG